MVRTGLMINGVIFATVCQGAKGWTWHTVGKITVTVKSEERQERRSGRTCADEKACLIDLVKFYTKRLNRKIDKIEFCEAPEYQFTAKPVDPALISMVGNLLQLKEKVVKAISTPDTKKPAKKSA